jgi:IclR family acetate operon transcriptional repressor
VSAKYLVPAVGSAIRILSELVEADGGGVSQADLVRQTGISKSTMHNLLATLEHSGYVSRDNRSRRYHLGGALIPLGAAAAREVRTLTFAVERLPALAVEHELSMYVAQVAPEGDAQIIERAYPPQPVHVGMRIGTRFGYFDGAIGKCLLAALPPQEAARTVREHRIPAHTNRTLTDPHSLLEEVAVVRSQGWGASIEEYNTNIAVAALLPGPEGQTEGVLVAVGFPSDLPTADVPRVGAALRDEAESISAQAGAAPLVGSTSLTSTAGMGAAHQQTRRTGNERFPRG